MESRWKQTCPEEHRKEDLGGKLGRHRQGEGQHGQAQEQGQGRGHVPNIEWFGTKVVCEDVRTSETVQQHLWSGCRGARGDSWVTPSVGDTLWLPTKRSKES